MAQSFANIDDPHKQARDPKNEMRIEMEENEGEEDVIIYQNDAADKLVAQNGCDNEMGEFNSNSNYKNFEFSGPIQDPFLDGDVDSSRRISEMPIIHTLQKKLLISSYDNKVKPLLNRNQKVNHFVRKQKSLQIYKSNQQLLKKLSDIANKHAFERYGSNNTRIYNEMIINRKQLKADKFEKFVKESDQINPKKQKKFALDSRLSSTLKSFKKESALLQSSVSFF
jgi:hypothetical protein